MISIMDGRMLRIGCAGALLALAMALPVPRQAMVAIAAQEQAGRAAPPAVSAQARAAETATAKRNAYAEVDWTDAARGRVRARWTGGGEQDVKLLVDGPGGHTRQFVLPPDGTWTSASLTEGDGGYGVKVAQRLEGTRFHVMLADQLDVELEDQLAPFLGPCAFVDYLSLSVSAAVGITRFCRWAISHSFATNSVYALLSSASCGRGTKGN